MNRVFEPVENLVARAPEEPGCYLWKSARGEILYVGKADRLRVRLKSYLRPDTPKTAILMRQARDLEWITTASGNEALILEANLVKLHRPRYNVRLKDDKRYPYICVSTSEPYPRLFITRQMRDDGNRYFGPFTDGLATKNTIALIHRIFPVRRNRQELPLKNPKRPCINNEIGLCLGPCTGEITPEEYGRMIDEIILFLEGKREILENLIVSRMREWSDRMNYERAAMYRDMLHQIRAVTERQSVMGPGSADEDILSMAALNDQGQIVLLEIRSGRLLGRKSFPIEGVADTPPSEIFASFIRDYYLQAHHIPQRIITPEKIQEAKELERFLSEKVERKISIGGARSPQLRSLLKMGAKNAELLLKERLLATKIRERSAALEQLQTMLELPDIPSVIECYDISHFQGRESVGSGVQFLDGNPNPKGYRHYTIRSVKGINDPAMIEEVIARRLQRLFNENRPLPDLIVIDGGLTQLNAAVRAAVSLGAGDLSIIGLAKKREEIYLPGNPVPLAFDPNSPAMLLLRHLRDEAHRFGITHSRMRVARALVRNLIEEIPDIGPARGKALLKHFREKKIEDATYEELLSVEGIGPELAKKILGHTPKTGRQSDASQGDTPLSIIDFI